jgi:hypothetical protein
VVTSCERFDEVNAATDKVEQNNPLEHVGSGLSAFAAS